MCHGVKLPEHFKGGLIKHFKAVGFFLMIDLFFSVLLFFLLSILTFFLLHVHHAGCDDGVVSGLAAVGHPGSGCRRPGWMAILCSGWVGDVNACLVRIRVQKYSPELKLPFFLCRVPIAVDLLVLKRQWKSFIMWSVLALLVLLVRIFS